MNAVSQKAAKRKPQRAARRTVRKRSDEKDITPGESTQIADAVCSYMHKIANVDLLNRSGEVALARRIIAASSDAGDLVADFFCGSGTVGVAAKELDRRYLLVDSNPDAVAIATERLSR